ncbi:MAG TPA: FAD-dependent oxidoreductase [Bacillota bacterium]|jgi:electron transfer flavoprotein-quinone oxidoreductase
MNERFDVIVVGAGPAGSAAALTCARAGLKVLVIERGEFPGAKNVMGGVLYRHSLEELIPGAAREAPIERPVIEQNMWVLGHDSVVKVGHRSAEHAVEPYNAFTVLRVKFDQWFAAQAVKAGALLVCETLVDDLLWENGKVVGVRTGRPDGDVRANVTIVAAGVNSLSSLIPRFADGRLGLKPEHVALAAKEIIALPKEKIEDRFNLPAGMGATIELVGEAVGGLTGTAFIYTNKETISIGNGAMLSDVIKAGETPNNLIETLKAHPAIKPLIAGGETKEYLAHLIPEGGYNAVPKVFDHGLLVCGDAAMLVNSVHREGSNLAMESGRMAGETAVEAHQRGDFSAYVMSLYRHKLEESFVLKDLRHYRRVPSFFEHNPHLFTLYPDLANRAVTELLTVDGVPKQEKVRKIIKMVTERRSVWQLLRDLNQARRALL